MTRLERDAHLLGVLDSDEKKAAVYQRNGETHLNDVCLTQHLQPGMPPTNKATH